MINPLASGKYSTVGLELQHVNTVLLCDNAELVMDRPSCIAENEWPDTNIYLVYYVNKFKSITKAAFNNINRGNKYFKGKVVYVYAESYYVVENVKDNKPDLLPPALKLSPEVNNVTSISGGQFFNQPVG